MPNKMCRLVQNFSMQGDEKFELIFLYSAGNSFFPWDIEGVQLVVVGGGGLGLLFHILLGNKLPWSAESQSS